MTNKHGFQAHNIAVRYYLMYRDLTGLLTTPSMNNYHEAYQGHDEDGLHQKKVLLYMNASLESLDKHFTRWISPKLLPAALMSESPTAKIVASIILKTSMSTLESFGNAVTSDAWGQTIHFDSEAHRQVINIRALDTFLCNRVDVDCEYIQLARNGASALLQDRSLRAKDCRSDIGGLLFCLHKKYLSLPSQTQFVETGVKDAKNVSATDRSEQVRTCMSVIRSVTPLGKTKKDANANKIRAIVASTVERINPHMGAIYEDAYKTRFNAIEQAMTKPGHFKASRTTKKIAAFDRTSTRFKRPDVNQAPKPQHQTPAVTGLIPYGKLTKKRNLDDHKVELMFRGMPEDQAPKNITERKNALKKLKTKRLIDNGVDKAVAEEQAKQHFMKQSTAPFKTTDD